MRYALPLTALAAAGIYGIIVLQRVGLGGKSEVERPGPITAESLTMKDPHYEGFNEDGGRYSVRAASAEQDLKNTKIIRLNTISGVLNDAKGVETVLKARRGTFDSEVNVLDLHEEVRIDGSDGMKARLQSARINIKDSLITSTDPVYVEMTAGNIRSREMSLLHKARQVSFKGEVQTHLNAPPPKRTDTEAAAGEAEAQSQARPFGASDQPVDIRSEQLDVDDTAKHARFTGSVRATQGAGTLESPALDVYYSGATPGLAGAAGTDEPAQGKVRRIVAKGPVVMTQATGDRVTSDSAEFDTESAKALLDGNVVMTREPDRRAVGRRAEIDQKAETLVLVGGVSVSQGLSEMHGERLVSDRKSGRTRLSAAPADGGKGRISARFFRAAAAASGSDKASAPAATNPLGVTFKTDPAAPVDLEADTLDVNDVRKAAVFSGNVVAVQGRMTLRTSELTAIYAGEAGFGATPKDGAAKGGADLQRIEARRAVVVQSQDGQSATGDWADYDTRRNTMTLGGDVVLTRGANVVRGSRLVIDMTSGKSVIETDPSAAWSARAQPAHAAGKKGVAIDVPAVGRRPSAVFYPKSLKQQGSGDSAATPGQPASGSWGPVTRPAARGNN